MYRIDLTSDLPIYKQIVEQSREMILKGILQDGEQMPSIRELAQALGINPTTVSKAYMEMEREGMIVKIQGKGSFIHFNGFDVEKRMKELTDQAVEILKEMELLGYGKEEILNRISKRMDEKR